MAEQPGEKAEAPKKPQTLAELKAEIEKGGLNDPKKRELFREAQKDLQKKTTEEKEMAEATSDANKKVEAQETENELKKIGDKIEEADKAKPAEKPEPLPAKPGFDVKDIMTKEEIQQVQQDKGFFEKIQDWLGESRIASWLASLAAFGRKAKGKIFELLGAKEAEEHVTFATSIYESMIAPTHVAKELRVFLEKRPALGIRLVKGREDDTAAEKLIEQWKKNGGNKTLPEFANQKALEFATLNQTEIKKKSETEPVAITLTTLAEFAEKKTA